jgi:hypothetical protein
MKCFRLLLMGIMLLLRGKSQESDDVSNEDFDDDYHLIAMKSLDTSHMKLRFRSFLSFLVRLPTLCHFSDYRREVLLIGDGKAMRFWPMWPFYLYLNRTYGNQIDGGLGRKEKLTLVTPETPNFRRGMHITEAIDKFCMSSNPIVYFLVEFF